MPLSSKLFSFRNVVLGGACFVAVGANWSYAIGLPVARPAVDASVARAGRHSFSGLYRVETTRFSM